MSDIVEKTPLNFIEAFVEEDYRTGRFVKKVHTRFPPEPNGYIHIGSAKAIMISYGIAKKYGGEFNLRFDDTNPEKEEEEFVESIQNDILWLGAKWDHLFYASDYFQKTFELTLQLIENGDAFVCDLTPEQIHDTRGTLTTPGVESPYRNRTPAENLDLFLRMKNGEFPEGSHVLRAKIDMASPNMNMRDPVIYRIKFAHHHRQGDKWCIYPMYDYAHPLQDAIEGITHSLCSLEFEDHRPLYEWSLQKTGFVDQPPRQIEFSKYNVTYTVMSKRYLRQLVESGVVDGWDDPRMPTLSGLRRRGVTPEALREFCIKTGVAKTQAVIEIDFLDYCTREDLKLKCKRVMGVTDPVKLVITNYPEGKAEQFELPNNPENPELGSRMVDFSRELYIENEDFAEVPPPKFHRLYPGNEVRLMGAYIIKCTDCVKDKAGKVIQINCTYDPDTKSGTPGADRKVKGTIHWVDAKTAFPIKCRLLDRLLETEYNTDLEQSVINHNSSIFTDGYAEACVREAQPGDKFQFVRQGYFCRDTKFTEEPIFIRTVSLKSSYKPHSV